MVVPVDSYCNCALGDEGNNGGKGTTIWFSENISLGSMQEHSWTFTDTKPDCYSDSPNDSTDGTQLCLIIYDIVTASDCQTSVPISRRLNNVDMGATVHSRYGGHNVTEAFDITQVVGAYNQGGLNTVTFKNESSVTVQINNFRIIRVYAIYGINALGQTYCTGALDTGVAGNLDYTRQDYPCNYANIGDRMSFVHYGADTSISTIAPGGTAEWQFQHPLDAYANNYVGPYACLFNFNNVTRFWIDFSYDLHYQIKLKDARPNGDGQFHVIADYYHGGIPLYPSQFPTVDLAKSEYYNDSPGATNYVQLYNAGSVNLYIDSGALGGIDIYRFYKVKNICQDTFSDTVITDNLWDPITIGGSVQTNPQLQVSVPGNGYKQAGEVTRYAYDGLAFYPGSDKQGFEAAIDITSIGNLRSLELLISDTRTTTTDPYSLNNFYFFQKDRTNTTIDVHRRLNGGAVTGFWKWWNSPTGTQKIKVSGGSIGFYENGILRHAEPFMLPSSNCYIYAYTSSDLAGTGTFDNFSIKPAEGVIKDNFDDGNYNGWTVDSGNWSVSNGKLQSSQNGSHIHYSQAISPPDRHVAADIKTIYSSGTAYVPFLMVNEVNGSNMIYADIRTDGTVELIMFYGGTPVQYTNSSSINVYDSNRIAVTITGINAKVYVNNQLYIDVDNNNFAKISNGYVGFYTYGSTGSLDNLVVFT